MSSTGYRRFRIFFLIYKNAQNGQLILPGKRDKMKVRENALVGEQFKHLTDPLGFNFDEAVLNGS